MRSKLSLVVALIVIAFSSNSFAAKEGFKLSFKIEGIQDTSIFLANYYGSRQYYKDTAQVNAKGEFVFAGDEPLPGGIYSIVLPDKKSYFEFIVNDQFFTMTTKKSDLVKNMTVSGSQENEDFYTYLRFIGDQSKLAAPLREAMNDDKASKADKEKTRAKLSKIDTEVKTYKQKMIDDHKDYFICKVFQTSQDPEVPPAPEDAPEDYRYRYFKEHYWDLVDFNDERLLRSPVFHNKLDHYMKKMVAQIPDSINMEADILVEKAKNNKEMYKYIIHYVTNGYEKSKIMGMDGVFAHMALTYYCKGLCHWVDSAQQAKICERATALDPLLVGRVAPNLILQDTTESKWYNLHALEAKYTILYFWDSGCGHCKKTTPKLKEFYDKFKPHGVEVFAVGTEFENEDWSKYIKKNGLSWINVSDNPEINKNAAKYIHITNLQSLNFRDTYDIFSTPIVYLLDKDKKIKAKRLGITQLDGMLSKEFDLEPTLYDDEDDHHDKDNTETKKVESAPKVDDSTQDSEDEKKKKKGKKVN